jgi:hypothetical protein
MAENLGLESPVESPSLSPLKGGEGLVSAGFSLSATPAVQSSSVPRTALPLAGEGRVRASAVVWLRRLPAAASPDNRDGAGRRGVRVEHGNCRPAARQRLCRRGAL